MWDIRVIWVDKETSTDSQIRKSRIPISTKLKLYSTCIQPIFLYSCRCWAVIKRDVLKTNALNQWCLWMLLEIKMVPVCAYWWSETDNQATTPFSQSNHDISLFEHTTRVSDEANGKIWTGSLLDNWRRPLGHPCIMWFRLSCRTWNPLALPKGNNCYGSESSTLKTNVYIWCCALLVMHVRNDDDVLSAVCHNYQYWCRHPSVLWVTSFRSHKISRWNIIYILVANFMVTRYCLYVYALKLINC